MVDMSLQFPVGTLADARGTAARAFGLLTADEAAAQRLATLGVTVGAHAEDWASAIDLSVAGDRLEQALPLVAGMVRRPAYPAQAVNDANAAASRGLDAYERNPSAAGVALLKRAIWGDADPRGHVVTPQERRDVSRQALLDFHARHVVPGQATLYVVGDVDPQRMRDLAERAFGGWKPAVPAPPQALPFTAPPHTGPRIILVDAPGAGQTSIAVGSVMPPFDKDASAAEALASAVVADVGAGRLNRNLREDKGWSYGFGGGLQDAPSGERLFVASGTVQADRTAQSLTELAREFAAVATTRPLTQAELDGQRDAMMRGAAQRFAGNGAVLSALVTSGAYGLPFDRAASSDRRLAAVTLDQAQAIASRMVRPDALTWVVIGDRRTIEPQLRALHLAPVEVWDVYGRPVR
jgi:predicted Zn-dependent peptidase